MENASGSFDAFISYSHAEDGGLAPALQHALQVFAKPWYTRRALRLFRDQTALTATPTLWPDIERALSKSRYFILLASPGAARSTWVQREVEWWLGNRRPETLLIVLTNGRVGWNELARDFDWQRTDALPPILKGVFAMEPLWVDLRWATTEVQFSSKAPAFQDAVATLAAPLRNCPKDDLIGEDVRQHRRALRLARGAVAGLVGLVIALAVAALVAFNERDTAISQQRLATSRQLAAQADTRLSTRLDLALLLAHQAYATRDTLEARSALLSAMQFSPYLKAFLHGQLMAVDAVAFSPDGSLLAGAGSDGSLQLWDVATLQPIGPTLTTGIRTTDEAGSQSDVRNGVAFSPDGKLLASAGADNALRLWDVSTRSLAMPPLTGHESVVGTLTFSHNGLLLASGSWDRTVRLWDPRTGQPSGDPLKRAEMPVTGLAFSPDDQLLAAASMDGGVVVWDVATRKPVGIVMEPRSFTTGTTCSVAFSPNGNLLITTDDMGNIRVWDVAKKREQHRFTGHDGAVLSVAFNADGTRLVSAGSDHTVRQWNMKEMREFGVTMTGHSDVVKSVAFSPDGHTIASSSVDQSVRLWDAEQNPPLSTTIAGHTNLVTSTTFSPDGRTIASASNDQSIRLWDVRSQSLIGTLNGHAGTVNTLSFRSKDGLLASGSEDGTVRFWDIAAQQQVGRLETGHTAGVKSVAFSPDGRTLATGGRDGFVKSAPRTDVSVLRAAGTVRLWDVATRTALGEPLQGHTSTVNAVVFSRDGKILASGSSDKTVRLWDVATRLPFGTPLTGHTDDVLTVTFSPDGKLLASGSGDGTVRLWDVHRGTIIGAPLVGHTNSVQCVAFSPDGALLASAGSDQSLRLWDVAHREPFASPIRGGESSVSFAPNGQLLVSGSGNFVRIWNITVDYWLKRTCMLSNRDLTKSEWAQFVGDAPYEWPCLRRR